MAAPLLTYDTFQTHSINFCSSLIGLALLDHLALKPFLAARLQKQRDILLARWFFVHAVANLAVVITGARAMWTTLTDPMNAVDSRVYSDTSMFGAASSWPLTVINAVHCYHMIGGFQLSGADYFHHLLFIPFLGFPGMVLLWGAVEPCGAFFISGLPGGISYFLLGLIKLGRLTPMAEKRITANLNCWVRVPGILLVSFLVYQAVLYDRHTLPLWSCILQIVLPFYNALYYCKQAVANYTIHYITSLLKQDPAMQRRLEALLEQDGGNPNQPSTFRGLSFKEALNVPQRGC